MFKKVLSLLLLAAMLLQLIPAISPEAEAATSYTDADWDKLIQNYKVSLVGGSDVDWNDPEIQKIVGTKNSSGLSNSGISYHGGRSWVSLLQNYDNPDRVFWNTDVTINVHSKQMSFQFYYLLHMARAYSTPGTEYTYLDSNGSLTTLQLYQNPQMREDIFYGLEKCLKYYNYERWYDQLKNSTDPTAVYGWYEWAVGAPTYMCQILLLMYPYATQEEKTIGDTLLASALQIINHLKPNKTGDFSENAQDNRRTRLKTCPMIAALTKNVDLMEQCRDSLAEFLLTTDTLQNGVNADHSYICHQHYALEGRYGVEILLDRVVPTFAALAGTAFEPDTADKYNQFTWIMKTFREVMVPSGVMTMCNGRNPEDALNMMPMIIKAALSLIGCFGAQEDLQLKQFVRSFVVQDTAAETEKAYSHYVLALNDVNYVQKLRDVVFADQIPADERTYASMRYCTDRAVQHQEDYTVGLAMSSNRIATYESIAGRNRYGWYTADGMLYVYNDETTYNYDQYGDTFQRFANMYRLPGTTEENSTRRLPMSNSFYYQPGQTYFYNASTKKQGWTQDYYDNGQAVASFVGGVELEGEYIAAAMDFEAYSFSEEESAQEIAYIRTTNAPNELDDYNHTKQQLTSDLTARKSYFMFDDEIVCVGSDIDFSTNTNEINTYVDNRELREKSGTILGSEDIIVDGEMLEKANSFTTPYSFVNPKWAHMESFGGYYFPNGGEVYVNKTYRQSSADGNNTNDDYNQFYLGITPKTEQHSYFELWINHGAKPTDETYSYVMLPGKDVEETEAYTKNPDIKVLKCTNDLHVVKETTLGITAMVFWEAGTYGDITVDQPMIVMVREQNGKYTLSVSEPTQSLSSGTISINRTLYASDLDGEIAVSGTSKTVLNIDFSKCHGKTVTAEFSTEAPTALMFDFNTDSSGKYMNNVYGFYDYSDAQYWATANLNGQATTIQNGMMSFPLTTSVNAAGEPNAWATNIEPSDAVSNFAWSGDTAKANFLSFDPKEADIFQIRFRLENATHYGSGNHYVGLYYLAEGASKWSSATDTADSPNPWREEIGIRIDDCYLDGGSAEGQYVTLTASLEGKKFCTYDKIKGIMIHFGQLRGGTVTIDYVYIGPKTESLYFGFENNAASNRYAEAPYGGFDYDTEDGANWGLAVTGKTGNYFTIDNQAGTLSVYATDDWNGSEEGKLYGPYIGTSSQSGTYPWSDQTLHSLSYDPENAEILQVRFKTEGLVATGSSAPFVSVLYVKQKENVVSSNSDIWKSYPLQNGEYQTLTIPLNENFRSADVINSLGLRFRDVKSETERSIGKIEIDYIYVGTKENAPSHLYFDFTGTKADVERYHAATYGGANYDDASNWFTSASLDNPTIDHAKGTLSASTLDTTNTWHCVQNSGTLQYIPNENDYIQMRLRVDNAVSTNGKIRVGAYYGVNDDAPNGTTVVSYDLNIEEYVNQGYFTVTFPMTQAKYLSATRINAIRPFLNLVTGTSTSPATLTIDYIYLGAKEGLPTPQYTVTFKNADGNVLATQLVHEGESASYTGATPTKVYDAANHYTFKGWDKALTNIAADTTFTAQFTATAHSYIYSNVDATNHKVACSCGYTTTHAHAWDSGAITTQPTCTGAGVKTYTCSDCNVTKTEAVSATGHTIVTDAAVAATCTTDGKTEGSHCSACNAVIVAQEVIPATGHSNGYSNNGTDHAVTCANCSDSYAEEHSYVDGVCVCGAVEVVEPTVDANITINHTLNLASDISIIYAVKTSLLGDYDSYYLECVLPTYEGNELVGTTTVTIEPVLNGSFYYFTLTGVTAVQMNDIIEATLHMSKDGAEYVSNVDIYSVATYAYSQLNKAAASDKLKALCADLLRYGAAAQTYKGYRTDALVNADMTEAHTAYLSDIDAVAFGNNNTTLSDIENPSITWVGKVLNLESKVELKFVMNTVNYTGNLDDLSLHVSYNDYTGTAQTAVITEIETYNAANNWYSFSFDGLLAAELRQVVSVAVYEGDTQVSPTLQYSADTYGNNKTGTLLDLCKALFAYSDTALAYFS